MATYKDILLLVDKVSAPLKKIQENTQKAQGKLGKLQQKLQGVTKGFQVAGQKIARFAKGVGVAFAAITGVVSAVGGAILRGANQFAEMGDRIDKMSQKIGMSRKAFQEWDYIMSQNGGNVETLQMGFKTLVTQIEGVQKGSKESINAFRALGVSVKDNNGKFRTADEVFNDTIRALQKIQNPTQKMILANRLFGRSAAELRPLLNQEAEAVDNLRQKANQMGLIISDEDVQNSVKFKDTMDTFSRFFQAKFATVMMKLMPEFSKALEDLIKFAGENQEVFDSIGIAFSWIVTKALPAVIKSVVWVTKILRQLGANIGTNLGIILSIPTMLSMAFNTLKFNVSMAFIQIARAVSSVAATIGGVFRSVFDAIAKWVANIIDKIQWVVSKIPIINRAVQEVGNNRVTQTQTNNSTTNTTYNTYNYGGGTNAGFTPLSDSLYVPAYLMR